MTALFRYPKAKHVRSVIPPRYRRYQSFKKALRIEFGRICVYCLLPDTAIGPYGHWRFVVEHYRPKKQGLGFEHLICDYDNLFYACESCNVFKGDAWWEPDFVPNPCDHSMFDHLRFKGAAVIAKSEAGRKAIELLRLNEPNAVAFREQCALTFKVLLEHLRRLDEVLAGARRVPAKHPESANLKTIIADNSRERALALEILLNLCGTVSARDELLRSLGYQ